MLDLVLGIDVGTTSVKAALLDQSGSAVAEFTESQTIDRPAPGHAEQDALLWTGMIDRALASFADLSPRVSVGGLTSQVNTHVFVDADDRPLMPAILWQDTRAAREAAELDSRLSEAEKIRLLGAPIPIDASHPLARMAWVARHRPDVWDRTARVLLPKDFCLLHLTGRATTDPLSNIGLVGADSRYIPEILALVAGAAERMAPITGLTETVGEITAGPLSGTPMVTATMDGWTGVFGCGASAEGREVYLSGTSEVPGIAASAVTPTPGVIVFAPAEGVRLHVGPTQIGGAAKTWFCEATGTSPDEMAGLIRPRRSGTPLFLPHLAGERAPLWNADLRGAFLGLDTGTALPELARAVYEGVAFSARLVFDAIEASAGHRSDELLCGGGGFRSDAWCQIRADVLGRPIRRLAYNEPGVAGAACLAAMGAGELSSLAEAHEAYVRYDASFVPDARMVATYDRLYPLWQEAIAATTALSAKLAQFEG
ncbi:xylulokinase [Pelagovum pacificum]|uniref:Carbohydrate kinase n=1 Tax=Pelagovum pacificum TaxID=2588711 RepID=A0A5C5GGE2_9RHOB|nr:FGGY-family carbohydrate kinase [Pelagovum pacificum]QQA43591.1 carbohydrate kinase [Pelagovum pacificum]TNY33274.1 carbohydrate kinase [Pelagovum pacificum]